GFMNGGKTFPIGISQLVDAMELPGVLSATDVYPLVLHEGNFHQMLLVNEMTKALHNPEQALFSIEFQAGGQHDFGSGASSLSDLHTRLCVSSGMRAVNHYLFFSGENDPLLSPVRRHDWGHPVRMDGTLRSAYPRYAKLSSVLNAYGADLAAAQPQTVTTIGFQLDDFMTEVNTPATQAASQVLVHQREEILFDMLGRGLALTHRPFDALELSRAELDPTRTPVLWVMMERACPAATQQKLIDYAQGGGRLVLAGRMCLEGAGHAPCTLLKEALGIHEIAADAPFTRTQINAFHYVGVPASFVETYTGDFAEVFAARDGATVGFAQRLGQGQVLVFGAAVPANTLEDLDLVEQMARKVDCAPLLRLSPWADARLSRGERGSFLFLNNYQDDPIETTVEYAGSTLFGGQPVHLPARQGLILPLDWQVEPGVTLHCATSEILSVERPAGGLTLRTRLPEFYAELSLDGYRCPDARRVSAAGAPQRMAVQGKAGVLALAKEG
ncbi:MAG: glycoside hydrolase, partial [Anaerolineales bacterium]